MARRLRKEEVVTIEVLADKGLWKRAIARQLGVADRTVRYHLEPQADGAVDGRKDTVRRAAEFADAIEVWWREKLRQNVQRPSGSAEDSNEEPQVLGTPCRAKSL